MCAATREKPTAQSYLIARVNRRRTRRGQALVEFAIIALALTFLFAAILSMGQMFFAAQVVQQAADVGAQELSRMPLNPTGTNSNDSYAFPTLNHVLYRYVDLNNPNSTDPLLAVRQQIFNEALLVVPSSTLSELGLTLTQYAAKYMPLINQLLVPVMFYDAGLGAYRYPGTVVKNEQGETTVRVLMAEGPNQYAWHGVVEEMGTYGSLDASVTGSFSVTASAPITSGTTSGILPGTVRLRINYPFQAAGLIAYQPSATNPMVASTAPTTPILADDSHVSFTNSLSGYTLATQSSGSSGSGFGAYAGEYGLGQMVAWGSAAPNGVRPFRRVVSGQGVYRREVFGQ
ncbi:MAG: pilus assembly protein [Planctomycetes bacterium]|nr:pilus assembly protein [Planctomycetota bacterium]